MLLALLAGCAAPASELALLSEGADRAFAQCVGHQLVDIGLDGHADFRWTEIYDTMGRKVRVEGDRDLDGHTDQVMVYTHDAAGVELSQSWDGNNDGIPDSVSTREFKDGRDVARVATGSEGIKEVVRVQYDASGLAVSETVDALGDGTIEQRRVAYFDEHGNRTLLLTTDAGARMPSSSRAWEYDARNLPVIERTDVDDDGHDEVVQTTEFDGFGRRITSRWDTNSDGFTDNFTFWEYDCPDNRAPAGRSASL